MLQTLGEMVWRYRCDLMLLSGRPSRLPAVAAILRETACLSPTRIVPLHSFRVGRWFTFRAARATIDRKRVVWGQSESVRVDPGGRRTLKKQPKNTTETEK